MRRRTRCERGPNPPAFARAPQREAWRAMGTRLHRVHPGRGGYSRRGRGRGFEYLDGRGNPVRDPEEARPYPGARDPAGVGGRVGQRRPERPPPGDRRRRGGAHAVPLPRRMAPPARPRETPAHRRARRGAPRAPRARRPRSRATRSRARPRPRVRRADARSRRDPRRHRGVREGERHDRAGDAPQGTPHDRARRRAPAVHRQVREGPRGGDPRRRHRAAAAVPAASGAGRGAARVPGRRRVEGRARRRHQRVPAGAARRRLLREGLPDLAGHGPRGRVPRIRTILPRDARR